MARPQVKQPAALRVTDRARASGGVADVSGATRLTAEVIARAEDDRSPPTASKHLRGTEPGEPRLIRLDALREPRSAAAPTPAAR
ncbi:MAG: hypothetical protein QOE01_464 [Actinomycetota bacterium]|jgi:hypothetical protein|nr:hypothetical protein [Actinomycetota bacterium]